MTMALLRNNTSSATSKFALVAFKDSLSTKILDVQDLKGPKCKVSGATVKVDDEKSELAMKGTIVSVSMDKVYLEKQSQGFDCRKFFGISKCRGKPGFGKAALRLPVQTKIGKAPKLKRNSRIAPTSSTKIHDLVPPTIIAPSCVFPNPSENIQKAGTPLLLEDNNSKGTPPIVQAVPSTQSVQAMLRQELETAQSLPTTSPSAAKDKSFRCDSFNNMSSLFNVSALSSAYSHDGSLCVMSSDSLESLKHSEILGAIEPPTRSIAAPLLAEEGDDSYEFYNDHHESSPIKYHAEEEVHSQRYPKEEECNVDFQFYSSDHVQRSSPIKYTEEDEEVHSQRYSKEEEYNLDFQLYPSNHVQSCPQSPVDNVNDPIKQDTSIYSLTPMELYNRLGNSHKYSRLRESQYEDKKVLKAIASESSRPEVFARNLLYRMFTLNELVNCNVYGRCMRNGENKGRLDAQKVKVIYKRTSEMYFEKRFSWRNCVLVMNRSIQHILKAFLLIRNPVQTIGENDMATEPLDSASSDLSFELTICSIGSSINCLSNDDCTPGQLDLSRSSHETFVKHQQNIHREIIGRPILQSTPRKYPTPRRGLSMTMLERLLRKSSTSEAIKSCHKEHNRQMTPMQLFSAQNKNALCPKLDNAKSLNPNIVDSILARYNRPETFSRELVYRLFTLDELSTGNVYGRVYNGQHNERLDDRMVNQIRKLTFEKFSNVRFSWRYCVLMINKSIRRLRQVSLN